MLILENLETQSDEDTPKCTILATCKFPNLKKIIFAPPPPCQILGTPLYILSVSVIYVLATKGERIDVLTIS